MRIVRALPFLKNKKTNKNNKKMSGYLVK